MSCCDEGSSDGLYKLIDSEEKLIRVRKVFNETFEESKKLKEYEDKKELFLSKAKELNADLEDLHPEVMKNFIQDFEITFPVTRNQLDLTLNSIEKIKKSFDEKEKSKIYENMLDKLSDYHLTIIPLIESALIVNKIN